MGAKTLVCRCEDVSLLDLEEAYKEGFRDMESLKRYTGYATGFCQGKGCQAHVARFLSQKSGGDDKVTNPTRTRPLLHPTPVAMFARAGEPELIDVTRLEADTQKPQTGEDAE